jgi:RNA polymerase sigma-70 factor, ECF subfamily
MTDWHAVVAEHGPGVWRTVYRILAHHADALDCYQETFLAALRRDPRSAVLDWGAYLTIAATRRAIDRLRERRRTRVVLSAAGPFPEPPARDSDPVDLAAAGELAGLVRLTLAKLPDRQAEVFWLSCVEGLSHDQIAAQMRTTPGAVRVLLHRARSVLTAALNRTTDERTTP